MAENLGAGEPPKKIIMSKFLCVISWGGLSLQGFQTYQVVGRGVGQNKVSDSDIGLYVIVLLALIASYLSFVFTLLVFDFYTNSEKSETFNYAEGFPAFTSLVPRVSPEHFYNVFPRIKSQFLIVPAFLTAFEVNIILAQLIWLGDIGDDPLAFGLSVAGVVIGTYKAVFFYLIVRKSEGVPEKLATEGVKLCCITDAFLVLAMFVCAGPAVVTTFFFKFWDALSVLCGSLTVLPVSSYYTLMYGPWFKCGKVDAAGLVVGADGILPF